MADQLIGDQHHVFPGDARIEFALAVLPFAKLVGQFPEPQRSLRRRQDIDQNLEALSEKGAAEPLPGPPAAA